jgi:phosphatidylserine decarboxylase
MSIAREGYPFILSASIFGVTSIGIFALWLWTPSLIAALVLLLFAMACAGFFRNPERCIPTDDSVIVSPADGKVLQIREVDDEYVGPAFRVDIFLSIFDVHINRAPASGTVDIITYRSGRFISAFKDKASDQNERNDVCLSGKWGRMRVAQIAGSVARRIVCRAREQESLSMGQIFGMIRFGSRTELTFPRVFTPCVKEGQHVRGGETVIGKLTNDA